MNPSDHEPITLRPGWRYSDRPLAVHIAKEVKANKDKPDQGSALCGAFVWLFGKLPGPQSDPLTLYDYCPECKRLFEEARGPKRIGNQLVMF